MIDEKLQLENIQKIKMMEVRIRRQIKQFFKKYFAAADTKCNLNNA